MPNLLAHFGSQAPVVRLWDRDIDVRWILLGCTIPDLPWIAQRGVRALFPWIDPYELALYSIAQASLAFCLLLCGTLALLSHNPGKVFGVLSLMSLLSLLLDALQTKWASGVHLLAPWSWKPVNWGFFWPGSALTYILTSLGVAYVVFEFRRAWRTKPPKILRLTHRAMLAPILLMTYLILPLTTMTAIEAEDSHFIETLRDVEKRPGRIVEMDRDLVVPGNGRLMWETFTGEQLDILGEPQPDEGLYSARARFEDSQTIRILELRRHNAWLREAASYVGLAVLLAVWVTPLIRRHETTP
jgi:hypothetical protein